MTNPNGTFSSFLDCARPTICPRDVWNDSTWNPHISDWIPTDIFLSRGYLKWKTAGRTRTFCFLCTSEWDWKATHEPRSNKYGSRRGSAGRERNYFGIEDWKRVVLKWRENWARYEFLIADNISRRRPIPNGRRNGSRPLFRRPCAPRTRGKCENVPAGAFSGREKGYAFISGPVFPPFSKPN